MAHQRARAVHTGDEDLCNWAERPDESHFAGSSIWASGVPQNPTIETTPVCVVAVSSGGSPVVDVGDTFRPRFPGSRGAFCLFVPCARKNPGDFGPFAIRPPSLPPSLLAQGSPRHLRHATRPRRNLGSAAKYIDHSSEQQGASRGCDARRCPVTGHRAACLYSAGFRVPVRVL